MHELTLNRQFMYLFNSTKERILHNLVVLLFLLMSQTTSAVSLRTIDTYDGLSSMFAMSLYQDSLGYMWVGTYNGVSMLEGNNASVMSLHGRIYSALNGNVIDDIQGGRHGQIWFHSNFGLVHWNARTRELHKFPEINGIYSFVVSPNDEVIAVSQERGLQYYNEKEGQFRPFSYGNLKHNDIRAMAIGNGHRWIVVSRTQLYETKFTLSADGTPSLHALRQVEHNRGEIKTAKIDGEDIFFIDNEDDLYYTTIQNFKPQKLFHIPASFQKRGKINAIVRYGNDIVIGFGIVGVVKMHQTKEGTWKETSLNVNSGVFDIKYDSRQGILWIATDGEGVKYFANTPYDIRTETFQELPHPISAPVRALQKDKNGDLWVATKGDGVLCYHNFNPKDGTASLIDHFTTENSPLLHNSIYSFAEGKNGIIWMGSDAKGINYYLPDQHKIGTLKIEDDNPIYNIHGITEVDGDLWIASWGHGVFNIKLNWNGNIPSVATIHQMLYTPGHWELAQFLSVQADKGNIWVVSRENGVTCIDKKTLKSKTIHFNESRLDVFNDVVSLNTQVPEGVLFASSAGLLLQPRDLSRPYLNLSDTLGLGTQSIRSIVYTRNKRIWFSTPHALIQHDMQTASTNLYRVGDEIDMSEFVEGAAYYDKEQDVKYFGGAGGFIIVSPRNQGNVDYLPEVVFHDLTFSSGNEEIRPIIGHEPIVLTYDQNYFTVKYDAIDYLDANSYTFEYCLNNDANEWIQNGHNRSISFINQRPGKYTIQVRYRKGNYVSPSYELKIQILPPWWLSWFMKLLYALAIMACVAYLIYRYIRKQRRRQQYMVERMNEKHREEVYESKLRFFTNITHEFSTPLTLISGPCQRILDTPGLSAPIKNYATIIQHSSIRLNDLIQELIELRRIDTGSRVMEIAEMNLTERLTRIATTFSFEAEKSHIDYKVSIQPDLIWNTDSNAFATICINLISNAFKYVEDNGRIRVQLATDKNQQLLFTVSNSGPGIRQEQIDKMFNRYAILENLEDETKTRGFARNGLGLAITRGLIEGLEGNIQVKGEEHQTIFTVTLPHLEVNAETPQNAGYVPVHREEETIAKSEKPQGKIDPNRANLLIVDDDKEMTWFLSDVLQKNYNIISCNDPEKALEYFKTQRIDLVISDIMMEPFDGLELCRRIKGDSLTNHIPVILLSSRQNEVLQVDTANAGAELFMTKPFDLDYLQSIVHNMLMRNQSLKDYFNSSLSAFDIVDGQHLHHEDKEMLDRMAKIIEENLTNPELSTQYVAKEMGIGLRNIYRKMATFTDLTPKDMIREARLERAKQLLTKTGMNVEEVCYQAGFGNRGTFYKLFFAKFGCTPKQYHEERIKEAKGKINRKQGK